VAARGAITSSPQAARELIQRLSQRLRKADDRIVNDKRRSGRAHGMRKDPDSQTAVQSVNNAYLAAKTPLLQRQSVTTQALFALKVQRKLRGGIGELGVSGSGSSSDDTGRLSRQANSLCDDPCKILCTKTLQQTNELAKHFNISLRRHR
jgi:hypothetical protein